jgi:hypothetical protein
MERLHVCLKDTGAGPLESRSHGGVVRRAQDTHHLQDPQSVQNTKHDQHGTSDIDHGHGHGPCAPRDEDVSRELRALERLSSQFFCDAVGDCCLVFIGPVADLA